MLDWLVALPDWVKFTVVLVVLHGSSYLMQVLSYNRAKKRVMELQNSLKVGDTILTQSGLYGTLMSMNKTVAMLKIAEGMEIVIDRFSIKEIVEKPELEKRKGE